MDDNNLYDILELNNDASICEIKKNFKKLALKFHPDKNSDKNASLKYNQIRMAYDILSDSEKKAKYDAMINTDKQHFVHTMMSFLKEITNQKTINNIMNSHEIVSDIKNGKINDVAHKVIQKILDDVEIDIDFKNLTKIFIQSSTNPNNQQNPNPNNQQNPNPTKKTDTIATNLIKSISEKEINDTILSSEEDKLLNIFGNVKTNIDDIYHNRLKEVIIKRKVYVYKFNTLEFVNNETIKYYIPLYDQQVMISKAGDKIIDELGNIVDIGDVFLNIYCKKDKTQIIQRSDYDLVYNSDINLYELFNGIDKQITIFGFNFQIKSENPFENGFDGKKITIKIPNNGFPCDLDGNRGDLLVNLHLIRKINFNELLKKYFE